MLVGNIYISEIKNLSVNDEKEMIYFVLTANINFCDIGFLHLSYDEYQSLIKSKYYLVKIQDQHSTNNCVSQSHLYLWVGKGEHFFFISLLCRA